MFMLVGRFPKKHTFTYDVHIGIMITRFSVHFTVRQNQLISADRAMHANRTVASSLVCLSNVGQLGNSQTIKKVIFTNQWKCTQLKICE